MIRRIKNPIGIVQGRLSISENKKLQNFPDKLWKKEFKIAADMNLRFIEFISEIDHNENNPIWHEKGIFKIKKLVKENNLETYSGCIDYVIKNNLLNKNTYMYVLNFIKNMSLIGCHKIILPLMGVSMIKNENFDDYSLIIRDLQTEASKHNIQIFVETLLDANQLEEFLKKINKNVKCVFDTGNIVNKVESLYSEISVLGDCIGHVHLKDKFQNNKSCLLGQGKVDFVEVFRALKNINYKNAFVIETPRGNNPIETCIYNLNFIDYMYSQANA